MKNNIKDIEKFVNDTANSLGALEENKVKGQVKIKGIIDSLSSYSDEVEKEIKKKLLSIMPEVKEFDCEKTERIKVIKKYLKLKRNINESNLLIDIYILIYRLENPLDLEKYNSYLKRLLDIFKSYNVVLTEEDFNLRDAVNEYMRTFFDNIDKEDFNDIMKEKFESLYWDNHILLKEIVLNIRLILFNKEKDIVSYINSQKEKYMVDNKIDDKVSLNELLSLEKENAEYDRLYTPNIVSLFAKGTLLTTDYLEKESLLQTSIESFINIVDYESFSKERRDDFYEKIFNLYHNLFEYKEYTKFKYLLDYIVKINERKTELKGSLEVKEKSISSLIEAKHKLDSVLLRCLENKEKVVSKKVSLFFSKNKKAKLIETSEAEIEIKKNEIKAQIELLIEEYKNYDLTKFEESLSLIINDSYSIKDAFLVLSDNENILRRYIKEHNKELSDEELNNNIKEFQKFVFDPYSQIIDTINYLKLEDVGEIITNKYKLLNIKFNLDEGNVNTLMESCGVINMSDAINKSGLSIELIDLLLKYYITKI